MVYPVIKDSATVQNLCFYWSRGFGAEVFVLSSELGGDEADILFALGVLFFVIERAAL